MEDLSDFDSYYIPPSVHSSDCTTTPGITSDSDTESDCSRFVIYNTDSDGDNNRNNEQEKEIVKKVKQEDEAREEESDKSADADMVGLYNRQFGGYIKAMQTPPPPSDSDSSSSDSNSSDSSSSDSSSSDSSLSDSS